MPAAKKAARPPAAAQTRAVEDYLEQIHNLIEQKGYARVVDIAANLSISQASVTAMIHHFSVRKLPFTRRGNTGSRAAYRASGGLSWDVTLVSDGNRSLPCFRPFRATPP
jgi:hypothetical protein